MYKITSVHKTRRKATCPKSWNNRRIIVQASEPEIVKEESAKAAYKYDSCHSTGLLQRLHTVVTVSQFFVFIRSSLTPYTCGSFRIVYGVTVVVEIYLRCTSPMALNFVAIKEQQRKTSWNLFRVFALPVQRCYNSMTPEHKRRDAAVRFRCAVAFKPRIFFAVARSPNQGKFDRRVQSARSLQLLAPLLHQALWETRALHELCKADFSLILEFRFCSDWLPLFTAKAFVHFFLVRLVSFVPRAAMLPGGSFSSFACTHEQARKVKWQTRLSHRASAFPATVFPTRPIACICKRADRNSRSLCQTIRKAFTSNAREGCFYGAAF